MKPKLTTRILRYLLIASVIIALAYALTWTVLQGYSFPWTGFGDYTKPDSDFVRGKTLWDWMQLFIIPIFLSIGVFFLNRSERVSERQRSEERMTLEREIAADRQRETALQTYLDRMADLLLKEKLRTSRNKEIRNVARIRTLTVLRGLDGTRKGLVLRFLQEAGLINKENFCVKLEGANLSGADLRNADLSSIDLWGANLSGADLRNAYLSDAILADADLRNADLSGAFLLNAELNGADLRGAIMEDGTKHE